MLYWPSYNFRIDVRGEVIMTTALFEIIELPDGEIALQRADGEGEPLLQIRFSDELMDSISDSSMDIAKSMIRAGVEAVGQIYGERSTDEADDGIRVLH